MKSLMNEAGMKKGFAVGIVLVLAVIAGVVGYSMGSKKQGAPASAFGRVLDHLSDEPHVANGQSGPASLESLLPQLEKKVAANPKDIDQRLLLAQTYNELGQREQSLKTLRDLHRDVPGHTTATIMLANMLMIGNNPKELQESFTLLEEAVQARPALEVMARLYQGEIRQRLGDPAGAKKIWSEQLAKMPADDKRRAIYENKIAGR